MWAMFLRKLLCHNLFVSCRLTFDINRCACQSGFIKNRKYQDMSQGTNRKLNGLFLEKFRVLLSGESCPDESKDYLSVLFIFKDSLVGKLYSKRDLKVLRSTRKKQFKLMLDIKNMCLGNIMYQYYYET